MVDSIIHIYYNPYTMQKKINKIITLNILCPYCGQPRKRQNCTVCIAFVQRQEKKIKSL